MLRVRRPIVSMLAAVAMAAAIAAPVAADTALAHGGLYGVHDLVDSEEYTSARCRYDDEQNLDRVTARFPIVFAAIAPPGSTGRSCRGSSSSRPNTARPNGGSSE